MLLRSHLKNQHGHSHKNAQTNVPTCMSHHRHIYGDSTCNYSTDLKLFTVCPMHFLLQVRR